VAVATVYPISLMCLRPCADDQDCAPTDTCQVDGHCRARTCDECPSYFACTDGRCFTPRCTHDRECPGGFCVSGSCAAEPGTCHLDCL
jgi:hypothetical protein